MKQDIRWKQRFQNFENTFHLLNDAMNIATPDEFQKISIIKIFEMCFELGWKTMKDYLESQKVSDIKTPRSVIKSAFEIELISNGHLWLESLDDRNETAHIYDEERARKIENKIREKYFPMLKELYEMFQKKV